ncbi:hypothetical protein CAPN002_10940 [Capnocytophaga stomatis]|uniref:DUF4249 family protein n=1 Tax=Capnocytophaga stomatis TaxID=1848904 RepID=UPI001951628A|nr:DUF4249 family protein [Capnocytophaga stomatis]GIJ93876.1 hypothetical protein CAPN002_10940 [Capnocytophaga stomatis]
MKKFVYIFLCLTTLLASCEEVIDLSLDTQQKQLVVDAYIDWKKGNEKAYPVVHLSYTTNYYEQNPSEKISDATIKISTNDGEVYILKEIFPEDYKDLYIKDKDLVGIAFVPSKGGSIYTNTDGIIPAIGKEYILTIEHKGKTYVAKEKMREVPVINPDEITQKSNGGIFKDKIEVKFPFNGFPNEPNNYFIRIKDHNKDVFISLDDELLADQKFFFTTILMELVLKKGYEVRATLFRVSPQYQQFVNILISNTVGSRREGGFTVPSRVYGNVVNTENPKENPLGAFRVSQYSEISYEVK